MRVFSACFSVSDRKSLTVNPKALNASVDESEELNPTAPFAMLSANMRSFASGCVDAVTTGAPHVLQNLVPSCIGAEQLAQ